MGRVDPNSLKVEFLPVPVGEEESTLFFANSFQNTFSTK